MNASKEKSPSLPNVLQVFRTQADARACPPQIAPSLLRGSEGATNSSLLFISSNRDAPPLVISPLLLLI